MSRSAREDNLELRQSIIDACLEMNRSGINQGTSGNISLRIAGGDMLITPSGVPYEAMSPEMIVRMPVVGDPAPLGRQFAPSSEWQFHQALLAAKPETMAVVHAHPVNCCALAVNHMAIPACHYMVAAFGGHDVPLADYALFGSAELSAHVVTAMADREGCLMANHGAVCTGDTLARAMWRMAELEHLAATYIRARSIGTPKLLSPVQIDDALAAFAGYGLKQD
ncbi:putative L-fuculose phosphate aldolase [Phaeobacter piscinae]|uniref:L-fuculose phosphate aldolase n=1 Tax=Phaeobacter piscinae TaxID=1580596 RepID=A0ABM6PDA8_9RHOB|nr:class II aldolase/adducin family protein [Phaeobacter piscinae]ATG35695.1 putative L-fuculose phosphate aldolase [Phaeobacter piscinae]AUQ86216.1 putative L-fuculose phosphate aldolase [Phaeobacter piscinae]AUR24099.1 putative L-fuculose phosphate aldolase [Phaeobacter piscinae]